MSALRTQIDSMVYILYLLRLIEWHRTLGTPTWEAVAPMQNITKSR